MPLLDSLALAVSPESKVGTVLQCGSVVVPVLTQASLSSMDLSHRVTLDCKGLGNAA